MCSLPNEPIPGELRFIWMQDLFPHATIIHIHEVNPAANRNQAGAYKIWAQAVLSRLGFAPDFVFASEDYGWNFAAELGARFVPVDPSRDQFPISGSELRLHPFRNWHFIPSVVRSHFVKNILINFSEIDRKSAEDIVQKTALLLNTLYVPLYVDFYQQFIGASEHPLSPEIKRRAQDSIIAALHNQAHCFLLLFCIASTEENELHHQIDFSIMVNFELHTAPHTIRDLVLNHFQELF